MLRIALASPGAKINAFKVVYLGPSASQDGFECVFSIKYCMKKWSKVTNFGTYFQQSKNIVKIHIFQIIIFIQFTNCINSYTGSVLFGNLKNTEKCFGSLQSQVTRLRGYAVTLLRVCYCRFNYTQIKQYCFVVEMKLKHQLDLTYWF